jgi:ribosomal protein S18 acetylase RimI-like enzyme
VTTPDSHVRPATLEDSDTILRTLEHAFVDDPFVRWFAGDDPASRARYFRLALHRLTLPHRGVWVAGNGAAAALWVPPGAWEPSLSDWLWLLPSVVRITGLSRYRRVMAGVTEVERHRPPGPWHLLVLLGTAPARRRQGLATAAMQPVLERCDREGVAAVLDTSVEANVAWYQRRGFRVTSELRLPDGPPCWSLAREPRAVGPTAPSRSGRG